MKIMSDVEACAWKVSSIGLCILSCCLIITLAVREPSKTLDTPTYDNEVVVTDTVTVHDTVEVVKIVREPIMKRDSGVSEQSEEISKIE